MIKIGVDAMGGDYAPEATVKGAILALGKVGSDSRIVLFGDEQKINSVLASEGCPADRFDIVATTEVIEMGDHPAKAFQSKTDSSITVGFGYLAKGAIDGFASAGSTGAMMVGSMYAVKPIEGVIRPTISSVVPTVAGRPALLLDVGLNVDCKPEVLEQYGLIGSIYAEAVLGIEKPRVAVLNIGEEETKGNVQTKAAYELLKADGRINFVGNVEASYIFSGKVADVIVCDGFVGNTVLKMAEGLYRINKALGGSLLGRHELRKRGRHPRSGCQCTCRHRPRLLFARGHQKHDPFDRAGHPGRPHEEIAACISKLIRITNSKS